MEATTHEPTIASPAIPPAAKRRAPKPALHQPPAAPPPAACVDRLVELHQVDRTSPKGKRGTSYRVLLRDSTGTLVQLDDARAAELATYSAFQKFGLEHGYLIRLSFVESEYYSEAKLWPTCLGRAVDRGAAAAGKEVA